MNDEPAFTHDADALADQLEPFIDTLDLWSSGFVNWAGQVPGAAHAGPSTSTLPDGPGYHVTTPVVIRRLLEMMSQTVGVAQFKARCLQLMDQVATTGNPVVITNHGKPVARLVPAGRRPASVVGALKGHIRIKGDIIAPVRVRWEAAQ